MKKILLLIISLLLFSCSGTRNVQKEKHLDKTSVKSETETSLKTNSEARTENQEVTETKAEESSALQKSESGTAKSEISGESENRSTETASENTAKTYRHREYFDNGNLKSETETSENASREISREKAEKEYFRNLAESNLQKYESETKRSQELSRRLNLMTDYKNASQVLNNKYEELVKIYEQDEKKNSERKSIPFWIYILIGFLGAHLLKFLWQKLKQSTWQLKIWEQLNKKR